MKKHITQRKYSSKVTKSALFVIDAIKRRREPGLIHDTEIAIRLGCAAQTISNWRSGNRAITLDQLCELVHQFNVNPNFLVKQEGSPWGEAELAMRVQSLEKRQDEMDLRISIIEKSTGKKNGKKNA